MTRKLFWDDPYQRELSTHIVSVEGDSVRLEASILYAENGGQESDAGTIAGRPVRTACRDGHDIVYHLDPDHGLLAGEAVRIELDWPRRQRLMRLHFAAEIVLELASRQLPDAAKIGAHISADKSRIDFAWPHNIAPVLPGIESEANRLIAADLPIRSRFTDVASETRSWAIDGFAEVACGGTHPARTGELGRLRLKRKNVGKAKERIEIFIDE